MKQTADETPHFFFGSLNISKIRKIFAVLILIAFGVVLIKKTALTK